MSNSFDLLLFDQFDESPTVVPLERVGQGPLYGVRCQTTETKKRHHLTLFLHDNGQWYLSPNTAGGHTGYFATEEAAQTAMVDAATALASRQQVKAEAKAKARFPHGSAWATPHLDHGAPGFRVSVLDQRAARN